MSETTDTEQTDEQEVEQTDEPVTPVTGNDVTGDKQTDEQDEPETFTAEYVAKLRKEAADARVRAKRADELTSALWVARVAATGRLADATDLLMPEGADPMDSDALTTAVDALLEAKPHLASRKPQGGIGQGATGKTDTVDLAGMLRSRA